MDNQKLKFDWDDVKGANKYWIKIDNETFETATSDFILTKNLTLGKHEWRVKAILADADSFWTQPVGFSIVSSEEKQIKKTVEEKSINIRVVAGGVVLFIILIGIVARPFYKRWMIKKKLEKTATDWCPHCHKFTGGIATCPHCGGNTMVDSEYPKRKLEKSKKE